MAYTVLRVQRVCIYIRTSRCKRAPDLEALLAQVPFPEAFRAPYADFPLDVMLRHENLVLELGHPVSEGRSGHVELCTNWTAQDVCPVKHVLRREDA